jgi:integrase
MALTVKRVAKLVRRGQEGRHLDGAPNGVRGLYLVVAGKGNANWLFRYQLGHRTRWMGLGSALLGDGITLDEARERAKAARAQLRDRIDPLDARRSERAAKKQAAALAAVKSMTFRQCGDQYIAANRGEWRNPKHAAQWVSTLASYAYPIIGGLPVDVIDTGLVLNVLEQPVKAERGYPAGTLWSARRDTASRLRGRIETVLGWAEVRGYRTGDNPARWRNHLEAALAGKRKTAPVEHHAALPYAELPAFMTALRQRDGVAPQALEFLILTAARTNEVIGARWSEIDLENSVWIVPASRMKAAKEHRVPLSDRAVALLRSLYRESGNEFVFIGSRGGKALSNMALTAVLKRMGHPVTAHGFRSTFRTWAAEQTNYPREVAEQALAHTISDAVERAYKRTTLFDKRRKLMEQWSRFCASTPAQRGGKVVSLHGETVL